MDKKKLDVKEEVKVEDTVAELKKQLEDLKAENEALKVDAEKGKKAISNANADAAKWKEQYKSTLDEAARKEAEKEEAAQEMQKELAALKAEKRISDYTKKLMEVGYDPQTATAMAIGLPEGISDDFFATQKSFLENQKQQAKNEALNAQPNLSQGMPPVSAEKESLAKYFGL